MNKEKQTKGRGTSLLRRSLIPGAAAILLIILYFFIASRYYRVFLPGTKINGVNVGGKSLSAAEEMLIRDAERNYALKVIFRGGSEQTITGPEMDLTLSFRGEIADALHSQNRFAWLPSLFGAGRKDTLVSGVRLYSESKLKQWLNALPELQKENMTPARDAGMQLLDTGRVAVREEVEGSWVISSVALTVLENAVAEGLSEVVLDDAAGTYAVVNVTKENAVLLEHIDEVNSYLDTTVTYTMHDGSEVQVGAREISRWLATRDDSGWYYVDEETLRSKAGEYVSALAEQYDYHYDYDDFNTTNYGVLTLPVYKYSFGYVISVEGETDALVQDILNRSSETRVPVYSVATSLDNGVGGTYVEVDIYAQQVYLYVDGELKYTSNCVTGTSGDPERQTPTGIYTIYDMETNTTLEGTVEESTGLPEYMSRVSYWMPFKGGYGLHDAQWRRAFGGNIYETSGSHGCVNLPYMAAQTIYQNVAIGTPVIVVS